MAKVREVLERALRHGDAAVAFGELRESGWIDRHLPELAVADHEVLGRQDPVIHARDGSVYRHSLFVVDRIPGAVKMVAGLVKRLGDASRDRGDWPRADLAATMLDGFGRLGGRVGMLADSPEPPLALLCAALFHDLAKTVTQEVRIEAGVIRIRNPDHDEVGAQWVERPHGIDVAPERVALLLNDLDVSLPSISALGAIGERVGLDGRECENVAWLVRKHMIGHRLLELPEASRCALLGSPLAWYMLALQAADATSTLRCDGSTNVVMGGAVLDWLLAAEQGPTWA